MPLDQPHAPGADDALSDLPDPDFDGVDDFATPRRGSRSRTKALVAIGVGIGALVVLTVAILGVFYGTGFIPPLEAVEGDDVAPRHVERLREVGILAADEELLYFYSWGLLDAAEGGAAVTDRGATSWYVDMFGDGEHVVEHVPYAAIDGVRLLTKGDMLNDSTIEVSTPTAFVYLEVSAEEGGDEQFLERLESEWIARGCFRPDEIPERSQFQATQDIDGFESGARRE